MSREEKTRLRKGGVVARYDRMAMAAIDNVRRLLTETRVGQKAPNVLPRCGEKLVLPIVATGLTRYQSIEIARERRVFQRPVRRLFSAVAR